MARSAFTHFLWMAALLARAAEPVLPGTAALIGSNDLSSAMVAGIDRWLMRETDEVIARRAALWNNISAAELAALRERLRKEIGAAGEMSASPQIEVVSTNVTEPAIYRLAGDHGFLVFRVRWEVFRDVTAEGLMLLPADGHGKPITPVGAVIVLPDADQAPAALAGLTAGVSSESQYARHLVQSGWKVLVPVIVSRADDYSGSARLNRFTNQPHREWLYRQAYEVGRHIIGYEVEKTLAAARALRSEGKPVALAGYGEGGLIALHAAALDPAIPATLVSGYFGGHDHMWSQPIYRNVFGGVRDFGDAELIALAAPGKVIIEHSAAPRVAGPPQARAGRGGAAPGVLGMPVFEEAEAELDRANELLARLHPGTTAEIVHGSEGMAVQFGSRKALALLAEAAGVHAPIEVIPAVPDNAGGFNAADEQKSAVTSLEAHTQTVMREAEAARNDLIWKHLTITNDFLAGQEARRDFFWRKIIGKIETARVSPNPRSRQIYDKPGWTGYEVVLDVFPEVFAWGYLLVPKDLKPGERRPVVVCQHGLEGVPADTVTDDPKSSGYNYYRAFSARLAERGFVVFAPHNPYRGRDAFRVLQRKANPLGLSLFSFIIEQHEAATEWLARLPFVDPNRIAFYGLSYGGKTAMRVPAVLPRYCLSICSGDFNEWVQKNATTESAYSYLFTGEYEMPEWDLAHTFNYAEMASLIFPRPFMVERGHDDGVAPDTWVAYEYAKVRRMYDKMALPDRTMIEFFNGPHQINGVGTFRFLHQHLNWPEPRN